MLSAILLASGCSDSKTAAALNYVQLIREPSVFIVEFDSDLDMEAPYAQNRHQKIVSKSLKCALGDDQQIDVNHKLPAYFMGTVQLHQTANAKNGTRYRYQSRGNFYHDTPGSSDMKLLGESALAGVLGTKQSVPCKVIMTVYMSSPYYSRAMAIPVQDIIRVTGKAINPGA